VKRLRVKLLGELLGLLSCFSSGNTRREKERGTNLFLVFGASSADASQEEKDSCSVDLIQGDIADPAVFNGIFERYSTQGGIYAVIHVAVSIR
jgi:hypothetical protein